MLTRTLPTATTRRGSNSSSELPAGVIIFPPAGPGPYLPYRTNIKGRYLDAKLTFKDKGAYIIEEK